MIKIYFVNGDHRVGLFAIHDILPKQEILFDYDGLNILGNKFSWVDDQKPNNLVGNKRLRKEIKVKKNGDDFHNVNDSISLQEFKSNLNKKIRLKRRNCHFNNHTQEKFGNEIEIDIFNIYK